MKTTNANLSGERTHGIVRGHIGPARAGTPGIEVANGSTEADAITRIEVVGGSIFDLGDGVVQIVLDGGAFGSGSFGGANGLGIDGMVPYLIPSGDEFVVPLYKQGLFSMPIDVVGTLTVDGYLIEVA